MLLDALVADGFRKSTQRRYVHKIKVDLKEVTVGSKAWWEVTLGEVTSAHERRFSARWCTIRIFAFIIYTFFGAIPWNFAWPYWLCKAGEN